MPSKIRQDVEIIVSCEECQVGRGIQGETVKLF